MMRVILVDQNQQVRSELTPSYFFNDEDVVSTGLEVGTHVGGRFLLILHQLHQQDHNCDDLPFNPEVPGVPNNKLLKDFYNMTSFFPLSFKSASSIFKDPLDSLEEKSQNKRQAFQRLALGLKERKKNWWRTRKTTEVDQRGKVTSRREVGPSLEEATLVNRSVQTLPEDYWTWKLGWRW